MKFITENQKGISLIITFFIMIVILAVVLSISTILYSEIKIIRNMGNSMASIFAADSGIEKVLYYDRQVIPTGATRGLCTMYLFDPEVNPNACRTNEYVPNLDSSVYCEPDPAFIVPQEGSDHGCDADVCSDCTIKFSTTFDNLTYYVTATVRPSGDLSIFQIESRGAFGSAQRQIQAITETVPD